MDLKSGLIVICLYVASVTSFSINHDQLKAFEASRSSNDIYGDALLDVPELIAKYGYPIEVHRVVTEDGYILDLHRIRHGLNNNDGSDKPVAFLMHGQSSSSADFVMMGPGTSLAYLLADEGFDVWLGNTRGNKYARRHVTLDPDSDTDKKAFWDFTWHEIGERDLPASIDYILGMTGKSRLHYVGYSQGTTVFFVMASTRPQYNAKIISMQAYAPVAYMEYNEFFLFKLIAPYISYIDIATQFLGYYEMEPTSTQTIRNLITNQCGTENPSAHPVCIAVTLFLRSLSPEGADFTHLPLQLSHIPAGNSFRQALHYGQLIGQTYFRRFDYGPLENLIKYFRITPPSYNLGSVTAPVYIYYGDGDSFVAEQDLDKLNSELPNVQTYHRIDSEGFGHVDFIWSSKATDAVFRPSIQAMKARGNN